jgi:hypothetical protein
MLQTDTRNFIKREKREKTTIFVDVGVVARLSLEFFRAAK